MDAALDAATPTDDITVAIAAHEDTNRDKAQNADDPIRPQKYVATGNNPTSPMFALYFSDDVSSDDTKLVDKLRDMIEVNGVPAVVSSAVANVGGACDKRRVDVTLGQPLSDSDTISVVKSSHTLGTDEDKRLVTPASATVVALPADTTKPKFTILGIADGNATYEDNYEAVGATTTYYSVDEFLVTFTDEGGFSEFVAGTTTATPSTSKLKTTDFEFVPAAGKGTTATNVVSAATYTPITQTNVSDGANKSLKVTVQIGRALTKGDKLRVKAGVIADAAGNKNVSPQATPATTDLASPKVSSVNMSSLDHHDQNRWQVPADLVEGAAHDNAGSSDTGNVIWIDARGDGDAAGAAGNDWVMEFSKASTYDAAKPLDIDVRTDAKGKRVTVRFGNGPAADTLGDLLKALNGNDAFAERFTAGFADCGTGDPKDTVDLVTAVSTATAPSAESGRTRFAIKVVFDKYVRILTNDASTGIGGAGGTYVNHQDELLKDVLAAAALRVGESNDDSGIRANPSGDGTVDISSDGTGTGRVTAGAGAGGGLSLTLASTQQVDGPTKSVIYYADTALAKNLPKPGPRGVGDLVTVEAGATAVTDSNANDNIDKSRDASAAMAVGYAEDVDTTTKLAKIDQRRNGGSTVTITLDADLKASE